MAKVCLLPIKITACQPPNMQKKQHNPDFLGKVTMMSMPERSSPMKEKKWQKTHI